LFNFSVRVLLVSWNKLECLPFSSIVVKTCEEFALILLKYLIEFTIGTFLRVKFWISNLISLLAIHLFIILFLLEFGSVFLYAFEFVLWTVSCSGSLVFSSCCMIELLSYEWRPCGRRESYISQLILSGIQLLQQDAWGVDGDGKMLVTSSSWDYCLVLDL
jgi:hypothetical protein